MSLALFHSADYHIGGYRWVPNYLQRTKAMLSDVLETVCQYPADDKILVIGGDFWDRTDLTEQERLLGTWFLASLLEAGIYVVQSLGNHEFVDESGLTLIHSHAHWARVIPRYFVVAGEPDVVSIETTTSGTVQFFCLPCTQQRDTADVIRSVALLREKAGPKVGLRYVVLHEAISSARDPRGSEVRISKALVVEEDPDIDGYLLGDIHVRQSFGKKTWYCGSTVQVKRDEPADTGLLLWEGSRTKVLPLDKAPKFKITVDASVVATAAEEKSSDIVVYVGSDKLENVASLPANIIVDPNYKAADVSAAVVDIVSSGCKEEAVEQLPAYLAELGHSSDEQLEAVNTVVSIIDKLGLT